MTDLAATGPLLRAFEHGKMAALRGWVSDQCRYRRADRRNAWLQGWQTGRGERLQHQLRGAGR